MNFSATASDARDFIKSHSLKSVVDIGCGKLGLFRDVAGTFMDYMDYSEQYPGQRFIVHDISVNPSLPFKDNEFEFSLCSHVLEHMDDPRHFLFELQRISSAGYIEVPLPLADNLLSIDGDHYGHKWWIEPGYQSKIVIKKRERIIENSLGMNEYIELIPYFAKSFNAGFLWQRQIDFTFVDPSVIAVSNSRLTRLALKTANLVDNLGIMQKFKKLLR